MKKQTNTDFSVKDTSDMDSDASQSDDNIASDASQSDDDMEADASQSDDDIASDASQSDDDMEADASQSDDDIASDASQSDDDMEADASQSDDDMEANESDAAIENGSPQVKKSKENLAWADAMARILKTNKPKRRKTIVLSRARRVNQIKTEVKEEKLDFEIEGEIKKEVKTEEPSLIEIKNESNIRRLKKKEWASKGHVKPDILERDREKALMKIGTRGVVQLFNAVREHQKTFEKDLEEAGPLEHKKDKVLKSLDKRAFLDVLMGPTKSQPVSNLIPKEIKEETDNPTWSILRDDFMMSSKLKDWDKQDASEVKDDDNL